MEDSHFTRNGILIAGQDASCPSEPIPVDQQIATSSPSTQVIDITTRAPVNKPPVLSPESQGVVDILRDTLVMAERGELVSIFVAYASADGSPGGAYDGKPSLISHSVNRQLHKFHGNLDFREK